MLKKIYSISKYSVADLCRDRRNLPNCSSNHIQASRDRWSVQIGDAWNVQNWLIYCKIWIWILQNLRCLSYNSCHKLCVSGETHLDVVVLVVRLVFLCLVVWYVWYMKLGFMKENIFNFALPPLCLVYMKFLLSSVLKLGCKRCIGWKQ